MTRACGHKQLCSSFFYHANGTVFTTDDSMSVLISLLLLLCFVFFKIMPTLLLRHILGLEKSTAACFQPPFARTVQAQHWSTPQTQTEQSLAQNKLIFIRAFPQLHGRRRPDAWCFWSLTPAEVPVGLNLFPVFALRLPRLVGSQDSRRVAFVWLQCFFPHLASNQTKCPDIFFFFLRLVKHKFKKTKKKPTQLNFYISAEFYTVSFFKMQTCYQHFAACDSLRSLKKKGCRCAPCWCAAEGAGHEEGSGSFLAAMWFLGFTVICKVLLWMWERSVPGSRWASQPFQQQHVL